MNIIYGICYTALGIGYNCYYYSYYIIGLGEADGDIIGNIILSMKLL